MTTNRRPETISFLLVLALLLAVLVALTIRGSAAMGADPLPAIPGVDTTPIVESGEGRISEQQAWLSVESSYGPTYLKGDSRASALVHVVDRYSALGERDAWVFVVRGLEINGSAPMLPDGTPASTAPLTTAYVFVDAITGEWITTRFEE
jgi:hypothetical protein